MAAEKVSQTRTASLLSFPVSPRLAVALRGSPPLGSSPESFSLALLLLRGARNKRIRYEFASPRVLAAMALSLSLSMESRPNSRQTARRNSAAAPSVARSEFAHFS